MSKPSQALLSHEVDRPTGWGLAIERAERGITEAQKRIERLRLSIDAFREFQERGEPWPGTPALMEDQDRKDESGSATPSRSL